MGRPFIHHHSATVSPVRPAKPLSTGKRACGGCAGVIGRLGHFVLGAVLALMIAAMGAPVLANVLDEAAQPGGSFSNDFAAPTPVPGGTIAVVGTGTPNQHDFLVFEGLLPGAQTITLTLAPEGGAAPGRNAGGEVYFKHAPFAYEWDGTHAGQFRVNYGRPTDTIEIALDAGFAGGRLYLALYYTHGERVTYQIAAPGNVALPAPVSSSAGAGVMQPPDAPGGAYSTQWNNPTPVAPGFEGVEGVGQTGQHLFFVFTDLLTGSQTLTFEFTYPDGVLPAYWAGGDVLVREDPFRWQWDGTRIGGFAINPSQQSSTLTLTTAPGFQGTLHVGLFFTYGSGGVKFGINAPSNATAPGLPDVQAGKSVRVIDERGQGCAAVGGSALASPQAAIPGACMEFVIEARNAGNGVATDIAIDDLLNANLIFVAADMRGFDGPVGAAEFLHPADNTDCATATCRISLRNGHLAPGSSGRIVIRTLLK
jgi:uncharacterized repeat protein (TIGR01451 family)